MAHPIVASYSTYSSPVNETAHPIPKPAGTQAGDLLIFDLGHSNTSNTFTPPSALDNPCVIEDQGSPDGAITWASAFLICGPSDPPTYTFFSSHSGRCTAICHRVTGHLAGQEATPLGVISAQSPFIESDSGVNWNLDAITPAHDECLGLYLIQNNGNGVPIESTSSWTTIDSLQSGGTITAGSGQKNLLNPPTSSSAAFGSKGNNGRYYGKIYAIRPAAGGIVIDLDLGHIVATPTVQPVALSADANLGLGTIDAKPLIRAVTLVALANLGLGNIDALATVYPIDIEQPTPATELDLGHILATPTVYPMSIQAPATLTLGAIDATSIVRPVSFDALTDFALQPIDATPTIYPIDIMQPGVGIELDLGHIIATSTVHPLELQATAMLMLQPIDATPTIRPINISVIAEINLGKIDATPTVYGLELSAPAQLYLGKIDALATVYPINLTGPIEARGDVQIMKIIGPSNLIKLLAKGDFIKILK